MAATTGIRWTDATANPWIGCTPVGPGCDGCYAAALALKKWQIAFEVGGERRKTKTGYDNPLKWQRMHDRGVAQMRVDGEMVPVPRWVFMLSLGDFFDNEVPPQYRTDAWRVIRHTPSLLYQIVTKRGVNLPKMLPEDWENGRNYQHIGIIQTVVDQDEADRDVPRLLSMKAAHGIKWTGLSIEPQLGPVELHRWLSGIDWVITGGESKQEGHAPRPYDLAWARSLVEQCRHADVPVFVKQMGDNPKENGNVIKFPGKGDNPTHWPADLRVHEMPRIYDIARAA